MIAPACVADVVFVAAAVASAAAAAAGVVGAGVAFVYAVARCAAVAVVVAIAVAVVAVVAVVAGPVVFVAPSQPPRKKIRRGQRSRYQMPVNEKVYFTPLRTRY